MTAAVSTRQIDNDEVVVTQWRLAPGAATGPHRHGYDYVIVPMTGGDMTIIAPDGSRSIATLTAGQPYFRKAGVEHDVRNDTGRDIVFLEIELKDHAG